MRLLKILSFLFLWLSFIIGFNSVAKAIVIEKIATKEGLAQNDVNSIFQDSDGFLWIGTNDGLTRYDGYSFKTFRSIPGNKTGLSSNIIFNIGEDRESNLWLATSDAGVSKFNRKTEHFESFRNSDSNPSLLSSNQIINVLPASDGSIWIGTTEGLDVLRFINDSVVVEKNVLDKYIGSFSQSIAEIIEDRYGRIWIGTKQGLFVFTRKNGEYEFKVLTHEVVKDIIIQDDNLFVANLSRVRKYKLHEDFNIKDGVIIAKGYNLTTILVNRSGDLYVGNNSGMYIFERKLGFKNSVYFHEGWEQNSLSNNIVTCLFEDNSGIIWIGTFGGGLNKYNPKQKKFIHFNKTRNEGSLSNNKIRAIFEDRDRNVWIGTEGGGINFLPYSDTLNFDTGFKTIDVNLSTNQNRTYSFVDLTQSGTPHIAVGNSYSQVLLTYVVKNKLPVATDFGLNSGVTSMPFAMLNDRNGNVWIGTYGNSGLFLLKKVDGKVELRNYRTENKPGSLSSNNIRSLLEDQHGNIWIGTDNGLNLLSAEEQQQMIPKFVVFKNKTGDLSSISHNYILPLFESKNGTIWVGTMGGGLNKMNYHPNPDSINFESITIENGLPSNAIKGILEDDFGFLWISSNKGITRFDVKDRLFVDFDINDGLQDYEFGELACCKLRSGEMLFGGVNGVNAFFPNEIITDMTIPQIAFTDFQILNQSVKVGEKVKGRIILNNVINHTNKLLLKYSENSFAIYFASLHFSAPGKNKYKYMLEGFDNQWVRTSSEERFAKYTNLNPGKYTFKVLSSNNDGVWTNIPKTLEIEIVPPWWMSNLAMVAYISFLILLVWFFQRYSLIRIRQKNDLLMEHFEREKIQELSQMKLRFFTNISHEFRTPLTLIIGPLEKLIKSKNSLSEEKVVENYSIMQRNASVLLRLINQLVDFRKFEQGKMELHASSNNVIAFLHDMFVSFRGLADERSIDYRISYKNDDLLLWFDPDILERIIYNLLSNAFKYTSQNGRIDLIVEEDDSHVVIHVADTGIGIPKDMQEHIFERFYQAQRIQNRKFGGTGIGLSFIKGLVELHKGEISFESEENIGTTFTVSLPKGSEHLASSQMKSERREKLNAIVEPYMLQLDSTVVTDDIENEHTKQTNSKPTIVVVEDNQELCAFLKNNLSNTYTVYTAGNGKDGLELIYKYNPEVVISDIMMPIMSGFGLCEAVKEDENISHTIVILLTAKTADEFKIKGYALGADAYISKPFSMEILETRMENLIESRLKLKEKYRTNISAEPSEVTTTSIDEKFMKRLLKIIEDNISNSDYSVEQLANDYGMSLILLNRKLKGLTGQTANSFIRTIRMKRAAQLFLTGRYSVADVTYEVGYTDLKYFRNSFKKEFKVSPSEYIKENKVDNL